MHANKGTKFAFPETLIFTMTAVTVDYSRNTVSLSTYNQIKTRRYSINEPMYALTNGT